MDRWHHQLNAREFEQTRETVKDKEASFSGFKFAYSLTSKMMAEVMGLLPI